MADEQAERWFSGLFDEHLSMVWRYARRRCGSDADADDVVAETFGVVWRRQEAIPVGAERAWLIGTARRVLANQRRSADRQSNLRDRLRAAAAAPAPSVAAPPEGPVALALAGLTTEDRDLLVMRAWDELAVHEIAVVLECTPNAASIRLHRAKRRFIERLDHERGGAHERSGGPPDIEADDPRAGRQP
jgi:RNA polymerase sigma-70 factor (ECF subfamily)